jgi:hypothetical protein
MPRLLLVMPMPTVALPLPTPVPSSLHPSRLHHRVQIGASTYVDRMSALADRHGEQFKPPQIVVDMAKAGGKFHK